MEFINVIIWEKLPNPLTLSQAITVVQDYLLTGISIINQQENHLSTFLELLARVTSRKKVFDVALAAVLKDNDIQRFQSRLVTL